MTGKFGKCEWCRWEIGSNSASNEKLQADKPVKQMGTRDSYLCRSHWAELQKKQPEVPKWLELVSSVSLDIKKQA